MRDDELLDLINHSCELLVARLPRAEGASDRDGVRSGPTGTEGAEGSGATGGVP